MRVWCDRRAANLRPVTDSTARRPAVCARARVLITTPTRPDPRPDPTSDVTRNSGAPGQISKVEPFLPFTYPFSPSAPSIPLTPLPLQSLPSPSLPSVPFHVFPFPPLPLSLFPTLSSHFLPSPSPHNGWRTAIAPPAGPGRAQPPNAIYSPKSASVLKLSPTCTRRPYNINSCEL